jgi:hypothetical protein
VRTAYEVRAILKTALEARASLLALPDPAVTVVAHWPTLDVSITDSIILGYFGRFTNAPVAVGRRRFDEENELDCQIRVIRAGAGDDKQVEADDRVLAILAEVDEQLRDGLTDPASGELTKLWIQSGEFAGFPSEVGEPSVHVRISVVEFVIGFTARTS